MTSLWVGLGLGWFPSCRVIGGVLFSGWVIWCETAGSVQIEGFVTLSRGRNPSRCLVWHRCKDNEELRPKNVTSMVRGSWVLGRKDVNQVRAPGLAEDSLSEALLRVLMSGGGIFQPSRER